MTQGQNWALNVHVLLFFSLFGLGNPYFTGIMFSYSQVFRKSKQMGWKIEIELLFLFLLED